MMLPLALLTLLLVESAATIALTLALSETRLVADRHLAIEADLAVMSAAARLRVANDSLIAHLLPGELIHLAPPPLGPWQVTARAVRTDSQPLARLSVMAARADPRGGVLVQRRLTLLLSIQSADTALVIGSHPEW